MKELNLEYVNDFQRQRFKESWESNLELNKNPLPVDVVEDAIILPPVPAKHKLWGLGGVINKDKNPVNSSWTKVANYTLMGGTYEFNKIEDYLKGEYTYLGYIENHWGHFLMDFTTRLYYAKIKPENHYLFIIYLNKTNFNLYPQIIRFFELAGLDVDKIKFINKVTQVEKLYIPEQSYWRYKYYTNDFVDTFSTVTCNAIKNNNINYEKIYLSRAKLKRSHEIEIGSEIIDDLFKKNNYKIIYPEQETLDDQINYINNCDNVALISGSLIHNLLFLNKNSINIEILNKSYFVLQYFTDTFKIKNLNPIYIDCYAAKYPVSPGNGPFFIYYSKNLKNYITANGMKEIDLKYQTPDFLKTCIDIYKKSYPEILKKFNKVMPITTDNQHHPSYYSPRLFGEWLDNFWTLENKRLRKDYVYNSQEGMYNDLDKFKKIINELLHYKFLSTVLTYEVHCSCAGWLTPVIENFETGCIETQKPIEALKIKFSNNSRNIYYQCFYNDEGWQEIKKNGELCGSTGKSKKINGIKIFLDEMKDNISIAYSIYTNAWSEWINNNREVYAEDFIYAIKIKLCIKNTL